MPSDSPCTLTATKNVVGRYINGVLESKVCKEPAKSLTTQGHFVHIEQDSIARDEPSHVLWTTALMDTFETTCAEGWDMDTMSKLCVSKPPKAEFNSHLSDVFSRVGND